MSYRTRNFAQERHSITYETLQTQIRVRIRVSLRKMMTPESWKEHHGKFLRRFVKGKNVVGEKGILTMINSTVRFQNYIL